LLLKSNANFRFEGLAGWVGVHIKWCYFFSLIAVGFSQRGIIKISVGFSQKSLLAKAVFFCYCNPSAKADGNEEFSRN